jgi:hypothetical protein
MVNTMHLKYKKTNMQRPVIMYVLQGISSSVTLGGVISSSFKLWVAMFRMMTESILHVGPFRVV